MRGVKRGLSRTRGMLVLACLILLSTAVGSRAASSPRDVVSVIKAQDRILNHAPATERLARYDLRSLPTVRVAKLALPAMRGFVNHLRSDVAAIAKATASGSRQRQGQSDYVRGVRIQIRGFIDIEHALHDAITGRSTAARLAYRRGQDLLEAGNVIANHGDKLLGLSTRY